MAMNYGNWVVVSEAPVACSENVLSSLLDSLWEYLDVAEAACDAVSCSLKVFLRLVSGVYTDALRMFKDLNGVAGRFSQLTVSRSVRWIRAAVAHTVSRLWRILLHGRWRSLNGSSVRRRLLADGSSCS